MRIFFLFYSICSFCLVNLEGQDNCLAFLAEGDSCRYQACIYLENAPRHFQLKREYHQIYDTAIQICPYYSPSYRNKSTAYLKTGDFVTWKLLIDQAVILDPTAHLEYRAWGRFQFFRDYQGALADFKQLEELTTYDFGYSQNGDYHLMVAKALCFKMIGNTEAAINLIENHIQKDTERTGLYDHIHLGVLYLEEGRFEEAIKTLELQSEINDLAENRYYLAMAFKEIGDKESAKKSLDIAKEYFLSSKKMFDIYTHQIDKIYLQDIEEAIADL